MQLRKYKLLPYPRNLWSVVLGKFVSDDEVPEDWQESLDYLLKFVDKDQIKDILMYYFREGMTMTSIGTVYGVTQERIRQLLYCGVMSLRIPFSRSIMEVGLSKAASNTRIFNHFIDSKLSVSELGLSKRTCNSLLKHNIKTAGDLVNLSERDLIKIRGIGKTGIKNIKACLARQGSFLYGNRSIESFDQMMPIELLNLSNRTYNALCRNSILTVEEILQYSEDEILQMPGVGVYMVNDLKEMLSSHGYVLPPSKKKSRTP